MRLLLHLLRNLLYLISVTGIFCKAEIFTLISFVLFSVHGKTICELWNCRSKCDSPASAPFGVTLSLLNAIRLLTWLHTHTHTHTFVRRAGSHWFWLWCACYCCQKFKLCSPFCDLTLECCCNVAKEAFVAVLWLVHLFPVYSFNFISVLPEKLVLLFSWHHWWNCNDKHFHMPPSFQHFYTWLMCNVWQT